MVQHTAAVALHAKGMGCVVDHFEVVVVSNFLDGIDVTRVAVAVHGHDGRGLRGNGSLNICGVQVQGVGVNVHKNWLDAVPQQGVCGGNKRIRGSYNLAGDAQGLQCGNQCDGGICKKANVLDTQVLTQFFFQLLVEWATVGEDFALPDFLQVGDEFRQRGQVGLGDVDGLFHGVGRKAD